MKRMRLCLFAVLIGLGAMHPPTPAQDTTLRDLSQPELRLWQAWIRADHKQCYSEALAALEDPSTELDQFRIALALLGRCADELGWHAACARDLKPLAAQHDGPKGDWLLHELSARQLRVGDVEGSAGTANGLGFVNTWWIAGPFANDRGQGFEDTQEPEQNLDLDAAYTGKDSQPVTWRALPVQPLHGALNLGAMLRPGREATAFLLTALWSEAGGAASLGVSSTDQWKAWLPGSATVGGAAIAEVDAERDFGFDQDVLTVTLRQGWNVLLVKSGVGEGDWKFRLRAPGLRVARDEAELRAALAAMIPSDAQVVESPNAADNWRVAALEMLYPRRDRSSAMPRMVMNRILAEPPARADEHAVIAYLGAWANRSSARAAAGREENRRRELLKHCLKLDPAAARAANELAQYYTGTFANPALADECAALAARLRPDWVEARLFAARVPQMKGLSQEIERELAKLRREFPDHPGALRFAAYHAGLREDYALSTRLFADALKADATDSYSRDRLLERAVQSGDAGAAIALAREVRAYDPFDLRSSLQLAEVFASRGAWGESEAELTRALAIAPRDDALLARLAELLAMRSGDESSDARDALRRRALDLYRQAIEANPNREDLQRYVEFLDRERPPFEAALQLPVDERIQASLQAPPQGDDPWEVVFREQITVVNEDGTTSLYTQDVYRVLNDAGRDALQDVRAPAWSGQAARCVEARVHRAAGGTEEGRRSRWGATLPPLEIGDVVHVRFRVSDTAQSFFGEFYGTRQVLADYVPVRELRLVWVLPEGRQFHEYRTGAAPERVEATVQGRRVWSYTAHDIAKLVDEPLAPPPHQRAATVQLSTYRDWREFGRWYFNLIRKDMEPTPEMTAKVKELTDGLTDEKSRARAVYNWVVTEVRYNADWHFGVHGYRPFSAGAVFARCIGDCKDKAILICTMLRIAGVTAWPVIINLEHYRGLEDITLPMPDHFNHAIACIEYSDGTRQFVDGTATYNGIDELPAADAGARVIVVRPDGGELAQVPTPAAEANAYHDDVQVELRANGELRLRVRRTARGDAASNLRARYQREGDRKRMIESEWSEYFAGAKAGDIRTSALGNLDAEGWIEFTVDLPGAYATADGELRFRLAPDPRQWGRTAFAALGTRRTEMLLPAPTARTSTWRFPLNGRRPIGLPADMVFESAHARLHVKATVADDELRIERGYAILGGVLPTTEYAQWRRALLEFDRAEAQTIRLGAGE